MSILKTPKKKHSGRLIACVFLAFFFAIHGSINVLAEFLPVDPNMNDILFFSDDCDPADSFGAGEASGDSTGEKAYNFFIGKGLSREQALGIVGNLMQESGGQTLNLNPTLVNPHGGASGIAQWMGGRLQNLKEFAKTQGTTWEDFPTQLDFLWQELESPSYSSVLTAIKAATTTGEALRIFLERFEIPCTAGSGCDEEYNKRLNMINAVAEKLSGVASDNEECADEGGSGPVDASGYAYPLQLSDKLDVQSSLLTCQIESGNLCHHDRSPAFDLMSPINTPTLAIIDGEIIMHKMYEQKDVNPDANCHSIQFKGSDGFVYWYGHTSAPNVGVGTKLKAGEVMGRVYDKNCACQSNTHLHIDRGKKPLWGGKQENRDPSFVPLMKQIITNRKNLN